MRRTTSSLAFGLALAGGLIAAFWQSARPAAAEERTLRIGLREDPDPLDPTLGSSYVARVVYAGMCDKLLDVDGKLNIIPQLATGYEYKDPTHLVIHLRPNVTFQDGEKLDAEAAKATFVRNQTANKSQRAAEISAVSGIDILDPLTFQLDLKQPSSPLLALLTDRAGIMQSPKAMQAEGDKFALHPVCAGPFAFEQRIAQDRIVLRRYPGYWDNKDIHFDQLIYLPIPNAAVRIANLRAGAIDIVEYVLPTDVAAVKADPNLKLDISDSLGYQGITFNTDNPPGNDTDAGHNALVRQAFELAIDREALIQVVYNGMYTPVAQSNTLSSPYYVASVKSPARDVDKAKVLLKQAGVKLPVPVVLTATNGSDNQQTAEVIQSMARDAGFDVTIKTLEFASSLQAAYSGNFQAYLISFSGRADPDPNTWVFLHSGGVGNYGKYSNATMDKLLDQQRLVTDVSQRREIYAQIWEQERKDMPLVYLWIYKNIVGMRRNIAGFHAVPDGLVRVQGLDLAP
jgi:peptide/nickel transport system substrate-binding protein